MELSTNIRDGLTRAIDASLDAANALRHVNLYRAAEGTIARHTAFGEATERMTGSHRRFLGTFADNDQDVERTSLARKMQLGNVSRVDCERLAEFVDACSQHKVRNTHALSALRQISEATVGPRTGTEALSYMRRAARRLHPDKTADLVGWSWPGVAYARHLPPTYRYEHAREGAAGLFALHRSLRHLHEQPYYQRALASPAARHGNSLTTRQFARDAAMLGAVLVFGTARRQTAYKCLLAVVIALHGTLAGLLVIQYLVDTAFRRHGKAQQKLILFRPQGGP